MSSFDSKIDLKRLISDLEDIDRIMTRDYSTQEAEVIPVDLSASPTIRVIPVLEIGRAHV